MKGNFGLINLIAFLENIPAYWQPYEGYFNSRLGDPRVKKRESVQSREVPVRSPRRAL